MILLLHSLKSLTFVPQIRKTHFLLNAVTILITKLIKLALRVILPLSNTQNTCFVSHVLLASIVPSLVEVQWTTVLLICSVLWKKSEAECYFPLTDENTLNTNTGLLSLKLITEISWLLQKSFLHAWSRR